MINRVLESKFESTPDGFIEMNIHEDIKEIVLDLDPECINHLIKIEDEILKLKEKGFNLIYTLGYDFRVSKDRNKL